MDIFNLLIKDCLDRHAPLHRSKITRPPAPWLNHSDVKQLQKERNELRYLAHKINLSHIWNKFREVRNTIQTKIKKVKRTFYQKALSSKKPKELYQVIHRILHPNPHPIDADPDQLNNHFSSTSQRLLGSVPTSPDALRDLVNSLPVCMSNPFDIRPVAYSEVLNQLKTMRSDCSTGTDQIPVKYLKLAADYIASPLTNIINGFIAKNSFPVVWKIARVSPLPKVVSPTELDHYRPIAILPALSKVYERLILNQIVKYIDQHKILNENVTGFRKGHTTSSVLLRVRDNILKAMNKGEITLIAFADFSRAFDTVDFAVIIKKLHIIGFLHSSLNWILNYLTGRKQLVQVNDRQSKLADILFGVPQGSILGPMLFNLYVNDLQNCFTCSCFQYADDTTVYRSCTPKNLNQCVQVMSDNINTLETWATESNLLLNENKTKQMLISTRQMSRTHNLRDVTPSLTIKNQLLERVEHFKLLGTYLSEDLKWSHHVKELASSCYGVLSTLRKIRSMTPQHTKKVTSRKPSTFQT